jgi:hypothetical protein
MTTHSDLPPHVFYPMYAELADYAEHAVAPGGTLITASDPGNHPTIDSSALAIQTRPVGSGKNGPSFADFGLSISAVKQNWNTTAAVIGEMDGINIVIRQGGPIGPGLSSDCSGVLVNIQNVDGTGYSSAVESESTTINATTGAVIKNVGAQLAPMDSVAGAETAFGLALIANQGTLNEAITVTTAADGASWNSAFMYSGPTGAELFRVDNLGHILINGIQVVGPQITGYAARLAALNAGTETPTAVLAQLITDLMTHGLIGQ